MSSYLIITAHDPRSARKVSIHFIAAELAKRGAARVFSLGFSRLSALRGRDPRIGLEAQANQVVDVSGVESFLWKTPLHPFNPGRRWLQAISPVAFETYRRVCPPVLRNWARQASTIIVESGIGVLLLRDLRRWNPQAEIVYLASDDLHTVGADPYLSSLLAGASAQLDRAILPSRQLVRSMPAGVPAYFVPHGIDPELSLDTGPSPFEGGLHGVSVGSMLFDADFFWKAVAAFPDVRFHVIGAGVSPRLLPPQISYYAEMPFRKTLPFLHHASFGIAPYRLADVPYYLSDTSMKLMQYGYCGLPAVCPFFAAGDHALRFAYQPGDAASITHAIQAAIDHGRAAPLPALNWTEVTERLLKPQAYPDTFILPTAVAS